MNRVIRPPLGRWTRWICLTLLIAIGSSGYAQHARYTKWNAGITVGANSMTSHSLWPTFSVHHRRWSMDLAPYTFVQGLSVTHHSPVLLDRQNVNITVDGTAFVARENSNYYVTVPSLMTLHDEVRTGLLAGASIFFLNRFSVQAMMGAEMRNETGPRERWYGEEPYRTFSITSSLGLQVRLFNNFEAE